jgi:hypothetical protein
MIISYPVDHNNDTIIHEHVKEGAMEYRYMYVLCAVQQLVENKGKPDELIY